MGFENLYSLIGTRCTWTISVQAHTFRIGKNGWWGYLPNVPLGMYEWKDKSWKIWWYAHVYLCEETGMKVSGKTTGDMTIVTGRWRHVMGCVARIRLCWFDSISVIQLRKSNQIADNFQLGPCGNASRHALRPSAPHLTALHHIATYCNKLRHTSTNCNTVHHNQHTATQYNTLQHSATHCTATRIDHLVRKHSTTSV